MDNKAKAAKFLHHAASGDIRGIFRTHVSKNFVHHNPYFRGDAESLMVAMEENAAKYPGKILEVQRTIEEDDLVVVHSRVRMNQRDRGTALVHIFRFKGGKIAEVWDIAQAVPENSPNEQGMF